MSCVLCKDKDGILDDFGLTIRSLLCDCDFIYPSRYLNIYLVYFVYRFLLSSVLLYFLLDYKTFIVIQIHNMVVN